MIVIIGNRIQRLWQQNNSGDLDTDNSNDYCNNNDRGNLIIDFTK